MPHPETRPARPPVRQRHSARAAGRGWALVAVCLLLSGMSPLSGQEAEPASTAATSPLELVALLVEPARASETPLGAETLCTLTVRLENRGSRPISSFAFEVEIEGRSLPVYEKQVFMALAPPSGGETAEPSSAAEPVEGTYDLRLFNFWTSDSQRPPPTDGGLDVRVRLVDAQWVDDRVEDDGTEVWSLAGKVPGLPLERAITLPFANAPRP